MKGGECDECWGRSWLIMACRKKGGYLLEGNRGKKTEYFVDKRSTWLVCIRDITPEPMLWNQQLTVSQLADSVLGNLTFLISNCKDFIFKPSCDIRMEHNRIGRKCEQWGKLFHHMSHLFTWIVYERYLQYLAKPRGHWSIDPPPILCLTVCLLNSRSLEE